MRALLEKAGLIDDQHALCRVAEAFHHEVLQLTNHGRLVPARAKQQPLDAVGVGLAHRFRQLPAVLTHNGTEERAQIAGAALPVLTAVEIRREAGMEGEKLCLQGVEIKRRHATSRVASDPTRASAASSLCPDLSTQAVVLGWARWENEVGAAPAYVCHGGTGVHPHPCSRRAQWYGNRARCLCGYG